MSEYSKYYIDDMTYFERREKDDMKRIMLKLINKISSQKHTTTVDLIDVSFLSSKLIKKMIN